MGQQLKRGRLSFFSLGRFGQMVFLHLQRKSPMRLWKSFYQKRCFHNIWNILSKLHLSNKIRRFFIRLKRWYILVMTKLRIFKTFQIATCFIKSNSVLGSFGIFNFEGFQNWKHWQIVVILKSGPILSRHNSEVRVLNSIYPLLLLLLLCGLL